MHIKYIMTNIHIHASELASLIGLNPYNSIYESMIKFCEKNHKDIIKNIDLKADVEKIKDILKDNQKIFKIEDFKTNNSNDLIKQRDELIKNIKGLELNDEQKKEVEKLIKTHTNKIHGIFNESNVLLEYSKKFEKKINSDSKYLSKKYCDYQGNKWYLGGKIDAISEDDIIIEVKNRVNKLFYELKLYEKPQIYTYMTILNLQKSHLVEYRNDEMNVIEESFDKDYWKEITEKLNKFIEFYTLYIKNNEFREKFEEKPINKKNQILNDYIKNDK